MSRSAVIHSLFCGFVILSLLAISPAASVARTVKVGFYDNNPLVFRDDTGRPQGIFIDLLQRIAAEEQWDLQYVYGSWPDCLDRLEAGEIDLLTAIAYSAQRAKQFRFTYETVITNWGQVFVPKNAAITSILDLDGKKIAVKMEDIHFLGIRDLTSKFNMECRFIEADSYDTVFELIAAGRVQAGVVNRLFGIQNHSRFMVRETPIMFNPIEVRFAAPGIASPEIISAIDLHLRKMQMEKDPFYSQTLNNWLVAPTEWILPDSVKYGLVGFGFMLVLMMGMSVLLRLKVKQRTQELSQTNLHLEEEIRIRKTAEAELRKYERIVATSTDHMMVIGLDYRYQAVNEAALKALGKSRDAVVGLKTWDVMGGILKAATHKRQLDRVFSGQIVKHRDWLDFPKLGNRYMELVFTPFRHIDGKITGCVVNSRDITERHELELKLENAQKMEFMGTIAGGVAHDLNNILSGIVSYPELLLMQLPPESPLVKPIKTIKKSGERAAVIVQDLLTLARRGVSNKAPIDLNEIVTLFLKSPECSRILSFHPDVRITTALTDGLKPICGSPVHLSKTVMNLVSNAAEAMTDSGEITISTRQTWIEATTAGPDELPAGEYVLLEVSDQGTGIARKDLKRIFEPFYTKKVMGRSGTGLGLAVVWGTVMDHHGHIDVVSDGCSGATFRLFFPVSHEAPRAATDAAEMDRYRGNGETILVVDDVEEQREIASNILSALGYTVDAVSSGEAAISYLNNRSADLVILDMLMPPGIDGLQTFEAILNINAGQKAIIASGFAETDRVKAALDLGVGQFIKKPYAIVDIGFAVRRELAG